MKLYITCYCGIGESSFAIIGRSEFLLVAELVIRLEVLCSISAFGLEKVLVADTLHTFDLASTQIANDIATFAYSQHVGRPLGLRTCV